MAVENYILISCLLGKRTFCEIVTNIRTYGRQDKTLENFIKTLLGFRFWTDCNYLKL